LPKGYEFLSGLPEQARKRRHLMPVQAFVDESGGKGQGRYFVMAGLIAHSDHCRIFSDAWQACLSTEPTIAYFKMREAAGLTGQFYGWSETEQNDKPLALAPHNSWRIAGAARRMPPWSADAHARHNDERREQWSVGSCSASVCGAARPRRPGRQRTRPCYAGR
jgi:hypothetical protein